MARKNGNHLEFTIPEIWNGLSVEDLLKNEWHVSKKNIHLLRMGKAVEIDGRTVFFSEKLQSGTKVRIRDILKEEDYGYSRKDLNINILYEDDFLLVANKPAGIATHPNTNEDNSLANGVAYYLEKKGEHCKVQHIHRLDKDTTGAVIFAKSSFIGSILDFLLTERKVKREYTAIVHGKLLKEKGTIYAKIGRDRHHATRRRVSPSGQDATTHYEVVRYDTKNNLSQINCKLDTGRTHQIRVHMSHLGHPLVGDVLYGGKPLFYRQALHGAELSFVHPLTMQKISVEAPFLDDFPKLKR